MWKFDKNIAEIFPSHARAHIPNYDLVIKKTIKICKTKNISSKIIDVGCAVGETLKQLNDAGFNNLHGVDSSQHMLDLCPPNIATYHLNDQLPKDVYDIIIMNWTLHFVQDKSSYLKNIFDNLSDDGIFILSEKTTDDLLPKTFYYDFKKNNGVTDQEIKEKEKNLKGILFLQGIDWYLDKLKSVGFDKIYIIDADWCFTTFLCLKEKK